MLSPVELYLIERLGDSYNAFTGLPRLHHTEVSEFATHIHELQRIIMARSAIRAHKSFFSDSRADKVAKE